MFPKIDVAFIWEKVHLLLNLWYEEHCSKTIGVSKTHMNHVYWQLACPKLSIQPCIYIHHQDNPLYLYLSPVWLLRKISTFGHSSSFCVTKSITWLLLYNVIFHGITAQANWSMWMPILIEFTATSIHPCSMSSFLGPWELSEFWFNSWDWCWKVDLFPCLRIIAWIIFHVLVTGLNLKNIHRVITCIECK